MGGEVKLDRDDLINKKKGHRINEEERTNWEKKIQG
jgi:hypothetical protein